MENDWIFQVFCPGKWNSNDKQVASVHLSSYCSTEHLTDILTNRKILSCTVQE